MRPLKLRSQLLFLTLGCLAIFAVFAAAGAWLAAQEGLPLSDRAAWLIGLCAVGAIVIPALLAASLARRLSAGIASLDAVAKALVSGAHAEAPANIAIAEVQEAGSRLAHAANVMRGRELALKNADVAKDEFLATLGHELRNPLAALGAAAHVLRIAPPHDPAVMQSVDIVGRQVRQMTRLIEDLLDVNRVIRGKVSLSRQAINLGQAVEKTLHEMRLAGRLAHHQVRADVADVWVRADEARLEQMIANLVGNAVKYTPAGGGIGISVRRDRDTAILRVRDTGIGMSPELTARVFDLFAQGEDAEKRGAGGLGIGLTLVKHLAELHGGRTFAASGGLGEGSVFTLSLPAIEASEEAAPLGPGVSPQYRHRILLVEDNEDARNTMFAALELDGHRVYEAADGNAGLRTVAAVKPDVAVIDIGLPDLNGYEVAAALRDSPERQKMVLIAMTGMERPDSLRRAREAGFDEYVAKPVAPDQLVRLIDAAKARRSAASARSAA